MTGLNRRGVIAGAGALGLAAAAPRAAGAAASRRGGPDAVVLVHGAWHGGWCWRDVRAALERAGRRVFTPTLTGLGERLHLLSDEVTLETHAADIANLIEFEELEAPLLVLHSYAGMPGTMVADRLRHRLAGVIYLDAAVPSDGESFISQNPALEGRPDLVEGEIARTLALADGGPGLPPFPASLFGVPAGTEAAAWVDRRLTPHPVRTWLDPAPLGAGGSDGLDRLYIHCTNPVLEPSSLPHHAARARQDPSWRYAELATGHDAMVTAPADTAAMIDAFARGAR